MKKATLLLFIFLITVSGYAQFPESFEGAFPPPNWLVINNGGPNITWAHSQAGNPDHPHTGAYAAYLNREISGTGITEDWLVTPGFPAPANAQLRFWSRLTIGGNQGTIYEIRVSTTSQSDMSTFNTIQTWTETQINPSQDSYVEKQVTLTGIPAGQQVYVAFVMRGTGPNGDRWLVDDVQVVEKCLEPTTLTASNMAQTTANLSWGNPSGATSWEIEVVPVATAPTGAGVTYSGTLPYTATGLTEDTDYKYYVRALCSPTNSSDWVGPFNFSTVPTGSTCSAPIVIGALPFSASGNTSNFGDDFEGTPGATGCGTTGNFLNGDEVVYAYTAAFTGTVSVSMTGNGANSAMFVYNSCANIGVSCVAGGTGNATTPVNLPSISVTAGTTYYVVISSSTTQSTPYNLVIQQVNCPQPTGLAVSNQNATSANLSWAAGTATSWEVFVQNAGAGIPAGAGTTTTVNTNYNVTQTTAGVPFTSATAYEYYVRADCNNGTFSAWTGPFLFQTTQVPVNIPYTENFEGTHGWTLSNGTQPVKWVVGTAVSNGGARSLYVSNDNGVTNTYPLTGATSSVHAYRDIQLPASVGQISLSFDWKSGGESTWDWIKVWSVPVTFVPTPGTQMTAANSGGTQIGGILNLNHPNWTTSTFVVDASGFQGQVRRIVFEWRNDGSGGTGVGGAIDNVNIAQITCSSPSALAVAGITQTSANASWTAPGSGAASYDYYVSTSATAPTETTTPTGNVATTSVPLTGLTASTAYNVWVRSNCGANGTSFWIGPFAFNTLCDAFNVPFFEGFNSASPTQFCWTVLNVNADTDAWNMDYATNPFEGNQSAMMYTDFNAGANNDWLISPTINLTGNQRLRYHYRVQSAGEPNDFEVLLSTSGTAPTNFTTTIVPLASYSNTTYVEVIVNLTNGSTPITGPVNIAWHVPAGGLDGWRIYVDNVIVEDIPSCPDPTNLAVLGSTTTTAQLSWTAGFDETAWQVVVQPQGTGAPTASSTIIDATSNPFTVTGLNPSTQYEYYVRANCAADDQSNWVGPFNFTTQCESFNVPFFEGFNTTSTTEFCWTVVNANGDTDQWDMNYATNPYEGNQVAMLYTDFNGTNNNDWLISPTINLTGNQRLRYRYRVQSTGEPNNFEVLVSTAGIATTSFTTTLVPLATYSNTTYVETIVNITDGTNLISGPVNIAWHVPPGGPDGWRIYIDSVVIEDIPPCPEPLNAAADCLSSTGANLSWLPGGSETEWEVAVVPATSPVPTSGTVVDETIYYVMGLNEGVNYTAYIRAVCPGEDEEVGAWVLVNFTTPETSVVDAEGFCASENLDQYILFDNVDDADNAQEYGQVACLGSTPNPVWYYLQVEDPGQLNFQLIQNTAFTNGNPTGTALDVDFVAYGPFTSLNEACDQIELVDCPTCPNNTGNPTFYPFGNIVDCSYSAAAVENFTIPNAQTGQIYAVLITNFNGDPGFIKLQQLPTSTGSTNCDILYSVDLGADQLLCGATEATITATVTTPGNSQDPTYAWFMDGNPITPTVVSTTSLTQTIEVTEPGSHVYSVVITVANASNTTPITDQVLVVLGPEVDVPNPAGITLCGAGGSTQVDLLTLNAGILGALSPADYTVEYYLTEADAQAGTNPIDASVPFTTGSQTIYVRIESVLLNTCFDVVPLPIVVNTTAAAEIVYADSPYCSTETTGTVTLTGDTGGTFTSTAGLVIDPATGTIDIAASTAGTYTVTYEIAATEFCPSAQDTFDVVIVEAPSASISYNGSPYCSDGGTATVTYTGTTGGTYSSTAGLVIDPVTGDIDLAASTAGTYTVTYTVPATADCAAAPFTAQVTITALPVATIDYGTTPYCSNGGTATVTQTGTTGGTYSSDAGLVIDAATGAINLGTSIAGTYTVTYTIPAGSGCTPDPVTASITITALPVAIFTYDSASYCVNFPTTVAPTFGIGAVAGTFTVDHAGLTIDPVTGQINPATSTPGIYQVTNTVAAANGCPDVPSLPFEVTIIAAPIPNFSYSQAAYCQEDAADPSPIFTTGEAGTFSATPAGLVINSSTGIIDLSASQPGTYTVTNTIAETAECGAAFDDQTVVINATPVFVFSEGCDGNTYKLEVVDLQESFDMDDAIFTWSGPAGFTPPAFNTAEIEPTEIGDYTVTVTTPDGCTNTLPFNVESTSCLIQKGISPGDDTKNNTFDLTALNVIRLSIFNRYGQEVFSYGAYTNQWGGQDKHGNELPTGTYFYSFERSNGETKTGWIYVNRQN